MKCRNDATEQCTCAGVEDYCPHLDDEAWIDWPVSEIEADIQSLLFDDYIPPSEIEAG